MEQNDLHRYDDIILLPHHVSETRPRMSRRDRAAQFAPFAALTGHSAAIRETTRRAAETPPKEYSWEDDQYGDTPAPSEPS